TTARGGGCATWSGWPTGWRRSPASWFRPRACCAGSLLTREHRAPRTVPRRPRKVVLVQHGHDRRGDDWLPGTRCGSSQDRAEGDERLGCVERPRHELRGSADAVNRGAEKAIAPRVEPEHALPRDRGVIELFGPLQAQVVEQRLHHACSRRIGRVAVVPRDPDLEAPRADQPVEDAAGRLEVILDLALLQEAPVYPCREGLRHPHVPNRNGRRARAGIQSKERLLTFALTSLHPAERAGRCEIDDLEFGLARAEPRREPSAF